MTPAGICRLILDEAKRNFIYDDATGRPVKTLPSGGYPTIAIGRNLSARGLTDTECYYLLNNDINEIEASLLKYDPWLAGIPPVSFDIVTMIEFNTGDVYAFEKMLAALKAGDGNTAAAEVLNSKAAHQGPARYQRFADAFKANLWADIDLSTLPAFFQAQGGAQASAQPSPGSEPIGS